MDLDLLIRNGFVSAPGDAIEIPTSVSPQVATILSNLATYGYTVDRSLLAALYGANDLSVWWQGVETALKAITGSDRNMGEYMVYKNFPREVLDMDASTYVVHQILIYLGMPLDFLREVEKPRPVLGEVGKLKVLTRATDETPRKIFSDLKATPNRWSDNQKVWATSLLGSAHAIVLDDFAFKENGITLAAAHFDTMEFEASSATDVLRLAAALSNQDISLRTRVVLRRFKRPERRRLLAALERQTNLAEDMADRPEIWKRLMQRLHPGDYDVPAVRAAYDDLYNKRVRSIRAKLDPQSPTTAVLDTAVTRPGEFLRRFHHYYGLFGREAVDRFLPLMDRLTTRQLVSLRAYLRTIGSRPTLIYPPRANWSRAQVCPNTKAAIDAASRRDLEGRTAQILAARLALAFPEGIALDLRVDEVKLQTNDQRLAEYGRGTSFDIPPETTFVRSASYWERAGSTAWFDNGWNFFDQDWRVLGACTFDTQQFARDAAIFSGDPVNSRNLKGRACQMVDLNLDKLVAAGVRYAVWSVLCYSKVKFSDAVEVLATLQMGENAETGRTYEPSRAQMVFPLKSETLTSYVAYLDLARRKIVYMDAPLPGSVMSAKYNGERMTELMPAYVAYLDSLPTLLDLLQDAPQGTLPVLYDDAQTPITGGRAFVFRPERAENTFERLSVTDLLKV